MKTNTKILSHLEWSLVSLRGGCILGSTHEGSKAGLLSEDMLKRAAKRGLSDEERRAQRVSFVMSCLRNYPNSEVEREAKREEIRRELKKHLG